MPLDELAITEALRSHPWIVGRYTSRDHAVLGGVRFCSLAALLHAVGWSIDRIAALDAGRMDPVRNTLATHYGVVDPDAPFMIVRANDSAPDHESAISSVLAALRDPAGYRALKREGYATPYGSAFIAAEFNAEIARILAEQEALVADGENAPDDTCETELVGASP